MTKNGSQWDRAKQLHDDAVQHGFDWPTIEPVIEKLREETEELAEAYQSRDEAHTLEELSDVLFVCSYLMQKFQTDVETLMCQANDKFQRRFDGVKALVAKSGRSWSDYTLEDLEVFWQQIKQQEQLQ